jgi:hypothetical protein
MKTLYILIALFISSCSFFDHKNGPEELPLYGHWCGPGNPLPGTNPIPIDKTDMACRSHDLCYSHNGYLNRQCDDALVAELKSFFPESEVEAVVRKAIISYFKRSPKL